MCCANTSRTGSIFKSLWIFPLRTYHGAPVIDLRILAWALCTISRLRGEREFISQCRLFAFSLSWVRIASICVLQVSRLSRCTPRYVTSSNWGSTVLFSVRFGQFRLFKVKVTCLHFCSFTFIRQSQSHFSTTSRWAACCADACCGHLDRLRIAGSSANVSCLLVGI